MLIFLIIIYNNIIKPKRISIIKCYYVIKDGVIINSCLNCYYFLSLKHTFGWSTLTP